tara:strand:+ start:749 stop:1498 length:750 start_codon:yes stop_codon:yes gene_type:complete
MKNIYKKTLIVSPHSDDEIFTLPFLYSPNNSFEEIDLLLIEQDKLRYKECLASCQRHGFNLITLPADVNATGLYFYEILDDLINYFSALKDKYDLILSPIIEGGHQDHDTICLAILYSKKFISYKTKIILFSTYRNIDCLPFLYTNGFSKKVPSDLIFSVKPSKNLIYLFLVTIYFCYKSQYKTWIMLAPSLLISYFGNSINKFVLANNLEVREALNLIPKNPLYQTYRKLSKRSWLLAHNKIIKDFIK